MDQRKTLPALLLAATFALAPWTLEAQEQPGIVSSRLMDAFESWSDAKTTYEDLALESHPELIESYKTALENHLDQSLVDVFAATLPATLARYSTAIGGETDDAADLLAFALGEDGEEYRAWQNSLSTAGLNFTNFIKSHHPGMAAVLADANTTPASRGIGLLDYVESLGDPDLFDEAVAAVGTLPRTPCVCKTFVGFLEQPYPWIHQIDYDDDDPNGPAKRNIDYDVWGRGAARDIDLYRWTKKQLWQEDHFQLGNTSSMRMRMVCLKSNEQFCDGPCVGEVTARVGYASRVYEKHDVGGIWSKEAQSMAADLATLTYSGPAPIGPALFEKGVAVSGQYHSGWNPGPIADALFSLAGLTAAVVADPATALTSDLINPLVEGLAGLVTHEGTPGAHSRDMQVTWENTNNPIYLMPNQTHIFELRGESLVYSRGYGKYSETTSSVDSGLILLSVARNYQCGTNVVPPSQRAYWLKIGNSNTVYDSGTLQNDLLNFIQVEMGLSPNPSLLTPTVSAFP